MREEKEAGWIGSTPADRPAVTVTGALEFRTVRVNARPRRAHEDKLSGEDGAKSVTRPIVRRERVV
jgi:hypothetical protein